MNQWIQDQLKIVMMDADHGKDEKLDGKFLYQHMDGHFIPQYDYIFEEYDEDIYFSGNSSSTNEADNNSEYDES